MKKVSGKYIYNVITLKHIILYNRQIENIEVIILKSIYRFSKVDFHWKFGRNIFQILNALNQHYLQINIAWQKILFYLEISKSRNKLSLETFEISTFKKSIVGFG